MVRRGQHQGALLDQPLDDGLREAGALVGVGARRRLVQQHQRARPGRLHDRHQAPHVRRERGQALGDGLIVADVREHPVEHRQARPGGGHPQPALVEHREQAERLERHGLAARVRARDHQRPHAGERKVDGHDAGRIEQRVAGPGQLHLVRGLHLAALPRARQRRRRERQVQGGQRGHRVLQRPGLLAHQPRQGAQDALLLLVLLGPQLAHPVVGLHHRHGLDEDRLAGSGAVVHDARHRRAGRRLDRQHRPAAALGGERLLQVRPQPHGQLAQQVGRLPSRGREAPADGGQLRRGRVEQPAGGIEGALQGRLHPAHRRRDPGRRGPRRAGAPPPRGRVTASRASTWTRAVASTSDRASASRAASRAAAATGVAHVEGAPRTAHAQVAQAQRLLGVGARGRPPRTARPTARGRARGRALRRRRSGPPAAPAPRTARAARRSGDPFPGETTAAGAPRPWRA